MSLQDRVLKWYLNGRNVTGCSFTLAIKCTDFPKGYSIPHYFKCNLECCVNGNSHLIGPQYYHRVNNSPIDLLSFAKCYLLVEEFPEIPYKKMRAYSNWVTVINQWDKMGCLVKRFLAGEDYDQLNEEWLALAVKNDY